MKSFFLVLFVSLLGFGCSQNLISEEQRIKNLNEFKSNDEFMILYLKFLRENNLEKYIVKYESQLLERKVLTGTDDSSYANYFRSIEDFPNENNRCITKEVKEKLFAKFFPNSEDFKTYSKMVEEGSKPKTKEYNFISYLIQAGSPNFTGALAYALKENNLTLDKKYFYLMCTVPFKECD